MRPTKTILFFVTVLCSTHFLSSCKKDGTGSGNSAQKRLVKYEITGTFSGKLLIVYNDNVNGNTVLDNVTLPWSKTIQYTSNVLAIGIAATTSTAGAPGQSATLKIYSGGELVRSSPANTGSVGEISFQGLSFAF